MFGKLGGVIPVNLVTAPLLALLFASSGIMLLITGIERGSTFGAILGGLCVLIGIFFVVYCFVEYKEVADRHDGPRRKDDADWYDRF
ncbi:MAG: hypothetical protein ACREX3_01785 [Gammaproteobacteria bacterium]